MNNREGTGISVIIPVYNRAHTILRCINSVLLQTFQPSEIVIVDDCSTDNTVELIKNISNKKIRLIRHKQNRDAQAARNTGIGAARCEWIAFLDSDDEWLPGKLEYQINELEKINFDKNSVVHCNAYKVYKDGHKEFYNLPLIDGEDVYYSLLKHPSPMYQCILTSKKALEQIAYLDEKIPSHQEWDTSIRLAKYCRFIHIKTPLVIWNISGSDSISGNKLNQVKGYYYIFKKHLEEIKKMKDSNETIFYHWYNLYILANRFKLKSEEKTFLKEIEKYQKREKYHIYLSRFFGIPYDTYMKKIFNRSVSIIESIYRLSNFYTIITKHRNKLK